MPNEGEKASEVIDLREVRSKRAELSVDDLQETLDNVRDYLRRSDAHVESFAVVVVFDDGEVCRDWAWAADRGGLLYTALDHLKQSMMDILFNGKG